MLPITQFVSKTSPPSPGRSWLRNALALSLLLHVLPAMVVRWSLGPPRAAPPQVIDIEMAPPPPAAEALPQETAAQARPAEPAAVPAAVTPVPVDEAGEGLARLDARPDARLSPDARPDARLSPDARLRPDARPDAARPDAWPDASPADARTTDASVDASSDAVVADARRDARDAPDAQSDAAPSRHYPVASTGTGPADANPDAGGAVAPNDAGQVARTNLDGRTSQGEALASVDGAPTTAGTAANLLTYMPVGHKLTALVRFDRVRGTRWQALAERIFAPMPDNRLLFGGARVKIGDVFDTLVVSSPNPRDATATTLLARSAQARPVLRGLLNGPQGGISWSAASGGMLGKRSGERVLPGDQRVFLSPLPQWMVLAQPTDLPGALNPVAGDMDTVEAQPQLHGWYVDAPRIEDESGVKRGPTLVATVALAGKRYAVPNVGLGITDVMGPIRATMAIEMIAQGWLVRGHLVFATEEDAAAFVAAGQQVKLKVSENRILQGILKRTRALNMVRGLTLTHSGQRVSYATSVSVADADAMLTAAASAVESYFRKLNAPP